MACIDIFQAGGGRVHVAGWDAGYRDIRLGIIDVAESWDSASGVA